jgi:acyl-coenzyme A synthetase/AMP-(fatty) acid ligase
MNNITRILFERNINNSNKIAFRDPIEAITYGELEQRSRKLATWMSTQGVMSGDRVSVVLVDKIDTVAVFLATCLLGAVAVMDNPRGKKENLLHKVNYVEPKLIFAEANLLNDLPTAVTTDLAIESSMDLDPWYDEIETDLNDMAFMLWTSGTTGHAKAVMHTHSSFLSNVKTNCASYPTLAEDRVYCTSKLFFAFGINYSIMTTMWMGAEALLEPNVIVPSSVRENIKRFKPTKFYSVPFVYSQIVNDRVRVTTNAKCFAAGDRLPQVLINKWQEMTGQKIYNMLGTTEVLNSILYNSTGTSSLGTATPGNSIRVINENGEIATVGEVGYLEVRAPSIAIGYYKDPEWSSKVFKEWVATGDVVYSDRDGNLHHMGRATDMIKIRGQYINPGELEETLQNYNGIDQVAVVSKSDVNNVDMLEAYVVLREQAEVTVNDLKRYMLSKHEKYMCPNNIHIVDHLPRTDTGKIQRYLLRQYSL